MYSKKKLTEKVHRIKELEAQISALQSEMESLKDEIKSEMTRRDVTELAGDDWKVMWTPYTASRFDQTYFKNDHPKLYEMYKVATESRRFSVK